MHEKLMKCFCNGKDIWEGNNILSKFKFGPKFIDASLSKLCFKYSFIIRYWMNMNKFFCLFINNYNMTQRSEEHTSELQSRGHLVCRLLLEKKKKTNKQ